MKAEDILGLLVPLTYLFFAVTEKIWPARTFPKVSWWNALGVLFLIVLGAISVMTPMLVPAEWLAAHRLLPGDRLGVVLGVVVGYPIAALVGMAYHRTMHRVHFLWRWTHQMHHAPQRLDMPGAVFFHPFDMILQSAVQIVTVVFLLGLDPLACAITGYVAAFYGMFQHWNVRTPRILGYVIQRPESHCAHHERGVHARNYSDFPLWDILFGTFHNPETFEGEVGFGEKASIAKMLVDVNAEPTIDFRPIRATL